MRYRPHDLLSCSLLTVYDRQRPMAYPRIVDLSAVISPSMLLYRALFPVTYDCCSDCYQIGPDCAQLLYLCTKMQSIASPLDESLSWSRMHTRVYRTCSSSLMAHSPSHLMLYDDLQSPSYAVSFRRLRVASQSCRPLSKFVHLEGTSCLPAGLTYYILREPPTRRQ